MSENDKDSVNKMDEPFVTSGSSGSTNTCPLQQETVWLKQHMYENAEMIYHKMRTTGLPDKDQNSRSLGKGDQQGLENSPSVLDKKLQAEEATLLKTSKTIWDQLDKIEKVQNCKAQVVRDVVARLALAVEEYQTTMSQELVRSADQLTKFRSLVSEVEAVIERTRNNLAHKKWGSFQSHEEYCQAVTSRLSQLDTDLHSCFSLYSSSQADSPKPDINRIVGEIGKISVRKVNDEVNTFLEKKDAVRKEIKVLMKETAGSCDTDSDASLEGSCSAYSDDSDKEVDSDAEKNLRSKTIKQDKKQPGVRSNRNNANNVSVGNRAEKLTAKTDTTRLHSGQNFSTAPVKRNAQGAHTVTHKKPDLFQFRGISSPARVPFLNQPGLLGPRPNILPMQGATQVPFRFSNFGPLGRQNVSSVPNSGNINNLNTLSALGQPRSGNIHFNFSSSQQHSSPFGIGRANIGQNSLLASMGIHSSSHQGNHAAGNIISNQMKQSKLLQMQQNQNKSSKPDPLFGPKSGFFHPLQQNPRAPLFLQNSQASGLGSHSLGGMSHENIEQQLNEMTQKIQQMQMATSQNLHLQQLMRETERLKQLVAMKQHQQQDQFKHQFQLLINAFMQQQQQQQLQGPQTKMARSIQFYNSQKQQQRNIHIRQQQQQTKKLKQENKVVVGKQEDSLLHKSKQASSSGQSDGAALQNGKTDLALAVDERRIISETCKVSKIGTFSPHTHGDKLRAGVSSVVVMEDIGCVVVVDIINSCLKLYNVTVTNTSPTELTHHLVTRLELSRPYYMSKLNQNMIVVSREGKLLSLVRVSKNRLECLRDLKTETQYYGLGYVSNNVIVCAAFADGKIDLLNVEDGVTQTVTLLTQCKGPELVAAVPNTGCILYLGRVVNETVHLLGISQKGSIDFSVDLESSPTDVWSVASISDRIVCCSKENGKVKLFSKSGSFVADINFPAGSVNQPFAMAFCDSGNMYIANDGAWDREYEHYVTTDINVYSFS